MPAIIEEEKGLVYSKESSNQTEQVQSGSFNPFIEEEEKFVHPDSDQFPCKCPSHCSSHPSSDIIATGVRIWQSDKSEKSEKVESSKHVEED